MGLFSLFRSKKSLAPNQPVIASLNTEDTSNAKVKTKEELYEEAFQIALQLIIEGNQNKVQEAVFSFAKVNGFTDEMLGECADYFKKQERRAKSAKLKSMSQEPPQDDPVSNEIEHYYINGQLVIVPQPIKIPQRPRLDAREIWMAGLQLVEDSLRRSQAERKAQERQKRIEERERKRNEEDVRRALISAEKEEARAKKEEANSRNREFRKRQKSVYSPDQIKQMIKANSFGAAEFAEYVSQKQKVSGYHEVSIKKEGNQVSFIFEQGNDEFSKYTRIAMICVYQDSYVNADVVYSASILRDNSEAIQAVVVTNYSFDDEAIRVASLRDVELWSNYLKME